MKRMYCRLTQAAVVGEDALQFQTFLPLVATAFTVAPQRHICRAVTDVVGRHDGTCGFKRSKCCHRNFAVGRSKVLDFTF